MPDPTPTPARPPLDLDAIRARANGATRGPWTVGVRWEDPYDVYWVPVNSPSTNEDEPHQPDRVALIRYCAGAFAFPHGDAQRDAEFIAHAREDVPALVAEVTALRADLDAARADAADQADIAKDNQSLYAQTLGEAEVLQRQLDAARAERTEPATGEDVERVIAAMLEAGGKTKTFHKPEMLDPWVAADVRATAEYILAALDLPGRERALREENERLRARLLEEVNTVNELGEEVDRLRDGNANLIKNAEILADEVIQFCTERDAVREENEGLRGRLGEVEAQYGVAYDWAHSVVAKHRPDHQYMYDQSPFDVVERMLEVARVEADTWWKRSEAQVDTIAELEAERDEAFTRLLNEGELADANAQEAGRLARERDAANAALADVAQKLDEAREERDAALAEIQRLRQYAPMGGDDECPWGLHNRKCECKDYRQHAGGEGGGA